MQHLGFTRLGNSKAQPLAIVHGWGCDANFLRPIAELFPDRDVYLIDLPGYGKSASLAPFAQDLSSTVYLLLNTIPDGADIMSWSFGTLYVLHALSIINNPCLNINTYTHSMMENIAMQTYMQQQQSTLPLRSHYQRKSNESTAPLKGCTYAHDHKCMYEQDFFPEIDPPQEGKTDHCHLCRMLCQERMPRIKSLITICGSPRFPADPNWPGLSALRILKINTDMNSHRLKLILHMFYRMQANIKSSCRSSVDFIRNHIHHCQKVDDEVLKAGLRQVSYMDERTTMDNLRIPSLHLFGAEDHLVPCSIAYSLHHDSLHYSYIFSESSHTPYLTEPERFETVVRAFFERNENLKRPIPFKMTL